MVVIRRHLFGGRRSLTEGSIVPSRPQSKPSPQWQEYVWRATLSGQRGSGAAGSRPLRWVDGASGSAAVSLRRSKAIEPASRPKSHGISVSALNTVAPNAASKVGGAMVEACRIRQGPAHFTRPPVACRFAPIVGVPSYTLTLWRAWFTGSATRAAPSIRNTV